MGRRRSRRKTLPEGSFPATIEALGHDGRGIARIDGKTTFIANALPGETVQFRYSWQRRRFDEGYATEISNPSPDRAEPPCQHADVCGGCSLQHMSTEAQLRMKQQVLAEQLQHFGGLVPTEWLAPLTGPLTGYRGKARLGSRYVDARETAMVGFREKRSNFIADITRCEVLVPEVGGALMALRALLNGLEARRDIPQIEVAAGDDAVALVFRHMRPLSAADQQQLVGFCRERAWHCYLQPGNESTVHRVWPEEGVSRLHFSHPSSDMTLAFHPNDFTQVNREINQRMVPLALDLLDVGAQHRVLDLFCGLGNFTLPLARRAGRVVGVELSETMVERGYENARLNGVENIEFHAWDLSQDISGQHWATEKFDRVLIDPPRSGALEMVRLMPQFGAQKLVYVSCNPATLARDAGELKALGYQLTRAGVMDMFPHTTHVESVALFERR
ncbi:MAG: 23S rRNA (uracil(1939)-C(5))-methyltransferase RlmD [Alcanivorax sp.]|nr:23S rRNA (uracil(1939)-C(5))-methyltransferase RlmD [Alcanivorax sp.]